MITILTWAVMRLDGEGWIGLSLEGMVNVRSIDVLESISEVRELGKNLYVLYGQI
jgi:hypothetical protein